MKNGLLKVLVGIESVGGDYTNIFKYNPLAGHLHIIAQRTKKSKEGTDQY